MKNLFTHIFKVIIMITLFVLIGIAIFAGIVWARWPLWVGFFIAAGIIGLFLGVFFFYKLFLKRKEQKFVSQIIEQDNLSLNAIDTKEREASKEMQAKWKAAMDALKQSHLKKQGNPLYVLPWYMIIGKSGTGKTTAIKSAKLSSSFSEVSSVSGISGTRNCDWWFFEQAILIDTAGRYAIPVDEDRDKDEWQKFLELMARYRKKEPLNGLIVTVSADSLNDMNSEGLEKYGRDIRNRIDELMRILGAKFPVYIMVTKCDLIQGMTHFSDCFSDETLGQTMGIVNHHLEKDPMELVSKCFQTMGERIRDIRLLVLQKLQGAKITPELILFPSEFEKLKPGFEAFTRGIFQKNPYQETPFFRGIFFSSGRQEGTPFSHFMKELGLISEKEVLPGTSKGLFLHDFFSWLLPSDRGLFRETKRSMAWQRLTRNIGLAAWTTIIIAICGILSFSFVKNLHTIKTASAQFASPQFLQGELMNDVSTLEQFRTSIKTFEESNRWWWIPKLGLNESLKVELEMKKKFCALMEKRLIEPVDKKMADNMANFSLSTPNAVSINHVEHLVKRIRLINARLLNLPMDELEKMGQPIFNTVNIGSGPVVAEETLLKIKNLYLYYLFWQGDAQVLTRKMNDLQKWLAQILSIKDSNLNWLVSRTNSDPHLNSYTLTDFWGKSPQNTISDGKRVAPGFTLKGKEKIDGFMGEIESALADPLVLSDRKREFHQWYKKAYFTEWLNFTVELERGSKSLRTREQWLDISTRVWDKNGPYFSLLQTLSDELKPFSEEKDLPEWVNLVKRFNLLRLQAAAIQAQGTTGALGQAASTVKSKLETITRTSDTLTTQMDTETLLKAGKMFTAYQESLAGIMPSVSSQRAAFDLATTIYSEDPATSTNIFFTALQSANKLKGIMAHSGKDSSIIWDIFYGPLFFYQELILKEASCLLQKKWEETVLIAVKDTTAQQPPNTILSGPDSVITNFLKGPCKPFINRGLKQGYFPVTVNGKGLAFSPSIFSFLSRGVTTPTPAAPAEKNYTVTISGFPTSANAEAKVQPHATVLELVCPSGTTVLENLNYPAKKIFTWTPDSECNVIFTVKIGSLVLIKKFQGPLSFPKFLQAFPDGSMTVKPSDFPDQEEDLTRMGIQFITAKYGFTGNESVVGLLNVASPVNNKVPMEILKCWE